MGDSYILTLHYIKLEKWAQLDAQCIRMCENPKYSPKLSTIKFVFSYRAMGTD